MLQSIMTLLPPGAGKSIRIYPARDTIAFRIASASPVMSRQGDDLVCSFTEKGSIVLENFYEVYGQDLPFFIIHDEMIAGAVFLSMFGNDVAPVADIEDANEIFAGGSLYEMPSVMLEDGLGSLDGLATSSFERNDGEISSSGGLGGVASENAGQNISFLSPSVPGENDLSGSGDTEEDLDNEGESGSNGGFEGDSGENEGDGSDDVFDEILPPVLPPPVVPPSVLPPTLSGDTFYTVDEGYLPGGTQNTSGANEAFVFGEMSFDLYGGAGLIVINGVIFEVDENGNAFLPDGGVSITMDKGTLVVNSIYDGTISYTYILGGAQDHTAGDVFDAIRITVQGVDGESSSQDVVFDIRDDAPVAMDDMFYADALGALSGLESTESVLDNDLFGGDGGERVVSGVGADDIPYAEAVGTGILGKYGTLIMNADGHYSYTLHADIVIPQGEIWTDTFIYSIVDADGSISTALLHVNLEGVLSSHWVIEGNLSTGTTNAYAETNHENHSYDPNSIYEATSPGTFIFTGADETLHVLGNMQAGTAINMGTGNDALDIQGGVLGSWNAAAKIGGDAFVMDSLVGGTDSIQISGNVNGARIGGDAAESMSASRGGDGDQILFGSEVVSSYIGGDAGDSMTSSFGGNADQIMVSGRVVSSYIGGDAAGKMLASVGGDNDTISISGDVVSSYIAGDSANELVASSGGHGDSILISGNVVSSYIAGDAAIGLASGSTGGNGDRIEIAGDVTSSFIAGDAARGLSASRGGDGDIIIIRGAVTDSYIAGDSAGGMIDSRGGDGDLVGIATLVSGEVAGDALGGIVQGVTAGADAIHIGTMLGGTVWGDANDFWGGNTAASGSNIITIDNFGESSAVIQIDGGWGSIAKGNADILSFGSGVDRVTLQGTAASLTATFAADDGNARTGSISITNTEVFDGGSGNDVLDASGVTGSIVLRGGQGSDVLTGNGSTIFHWSARDITAGAVDIVTLKAGDTLLLGDGITATWESGNILNLTASGVTQRVELLGAVDSSALQSVSEATSTEINTVLSNNIDMALEMAAQLASLMTE